jgi:hypothetical protein
LQQRRLATLKPDEVELGSQSRQDVEDLGSRQNWSCNPGVRERYELTIVEELMFVCGERRGHTLWNERVPGTELGLNL